MPRLNGSRRTCAPCSRATSAVRSTEPSSTTTISNPGSNARSSSITPPIAPSSFSAGTIAILLATCGDSLQQARELEHTAGAVRIRVLVQGALARAPPELLGLRRIAEQQAVRGKRLVRVRDDEQFPAGLEPAFDSLVRIRDDRGSGSRELERAGGRRCEDRCVGAARDVQVDARGGDRPSEDVEGHVAELARVADVAAEVAA